MKALLLFLLLVPSAALAQMPDTTDIYGERQDTLQATVFSASGQGNFISRGRDIRTEVISAAGLCKMACCNLAESFENSSSVTVGYSDAITGARQIRLLGQNGIYTQMLDENRPIMRGLSAPFGLNYVPGQWLESIQIAKGVTSVINGVESMTGQINMEHRKPTDEKPLFVQGSVMDDSKADLNVASAWQFGPKWSTIVLAHADANFKQMDHNRDGFLDDPMARQVSLSNRWLYFDPSGAQVRFGLRAILDRREGGQTDPSGWRSDILNKNLGAYVKVGVPLNEANTSNVAAVADYTFQSMASTFGPVRSYDASQHSGFVNLLYQNQDSESHHFTLGLSDTFDRYGELFCGAPSTTVLNDFGAFGEYTFRKEDVLTAIFGLRADLFGTQLRVSPRLTVKYTPWDWLVLRANGGRGLRYSTPLVDNFGALSTGKTFAGAYAEHPLEDSWTFGGNATFQWGKTSLSLDYFHTSFTEQLIVSNGPEKIHFGTLSSMEGGYSHTDNFQADLALEPVERFTISLTGRYTDARQTTLWQSDDIKPMTSLFKAVLNLQWAARLNKWIFDFTASLNGPCRLWDFEDKGLTSPTYPLLYAQITKRFKGFDVYVGGENLCNFTQKDPIVSSPDRTSFDASCVWGPLMGIKLYAGFRITIWKKE